VTADEKSSDAVVDVDAQDNRLVDEPRGACMMSMMPMVWIAMERTERLLIGQMRAGGKG